MQSIGWSCSYSSVAAVTYSSKMFFGRDQSVIQHFERKNLKFAPENERNENQEEKELNKETC